MSLNKLYIKLITKNPEYYTLFINGQKIKPNIYKRHLDTEIVCDNLSHKIIKLKKEVYFLKQNNWKKKLAKFWFLNILAGFYDNVIEKEGFIEADLELNISSINNGKITLNLNENNDNKFKIQSENLDYDIVKNVIRIDDELKQRFGYYMKLKKIIIASLIVILTLAILISKFKINIF